MSSTWGEETTIERLIRWAELESTYTGAELEANWEAMFRTIALFRRVATEVGDRLGYAYPRSLDGRAVAYLQKVRKLARRAESFSEAHQEM